MTQTIEKSKRERTADTLNRSLADQETECIAFMASKCFFDVPMPLVKNGDKIKFARKKGWFKKIRVV